MVQCANDTTMTSVATDQLNLQTIPISAQKCHKFDHIATPLLSVKTFCDSDLEVLFIRDKVKVTNEGGDTVLEGALDPTTDLYMVSLDDQPDAIPPQGGDIQAHKAMGTKEAGSNKGNTKNIAETINMHHLALGSPTKATFLQAIEKGWLTGFPSLTVENAKQFCTKKAQTILGHQKLIRKNIQSTRISVPKDPTPRTNCHRIGISAVSDKDLRNLVCMDQLGRYPITSPRGNQYAMIMYDYNSAYINAIPMSHGNQLSL